MEGSEANFSPNFDFKLINTILSFPKFTHPPFASLKKYVYFRKDQYLRRRLGWGGISPLNIGGKL